MAASATDKFKKLTNNFSTTLSGAIVGASDTSMSLASTTNLPTDTGTVFVIDRVNSSGVATPSLREYVKGTVSGSNVTNLVRGLGGSTAQAHLTGAVVEQVVDQNTINDIIDGILAQHNQDGTHGAVTATSVTATSVTAPTISSSNNRNVVNFAPAGVIHPYAGVTAPTDWLLCDGSAVSRATYATLFSAISPTIGTFTVTIATPAVVTLTGHGLQTGDQLYLTTTGALPTGLSTNTLYFAIRIDANTVNLATSRANAYAGTKIATSGTQSGTHSLVQCPYGLGDGSTTFNVPDLRGRVLAGNDYMGGTAASRLNLAQAQGTYGNLGASGGEQGHAQTLSELATHNHTDAGHTHGEQVATGSSAGTGITGTANLVGNTPANQSTQTGFASINNAGSGTAANVVQPTIVTNYIIKT